MIRLHAFSETAEYDSFSHASLVPPPAAEIPRDGADLYLAVERDRCLAARCSLWWSTVPPLEGARAGYIGHYAAADDRAAETLLESACRELAKHRCAVAIGPVDGSTWRKYRFVVERGGEPPFFLEPDNPDEWPAQFLRCGFAILARPPRRQRSPCARFRSREEGGRSRVDLRRVGRQLLAQFSVHVDRPGRIPVTVPPDSPLRRAGARHTGRA